MPVDFKKFETKKKNFEEKMFFKFFLVLGHWPPSSVHKKIRPIGPAVWPAIRNIYMNLFIYDWYMSGPQGLTLFDIVRGGGVSLFMEWGSGVANPMFVYCL